MNFYRCKAKQAAVRSTAQGIVVIDPDGVDNDARAPLIREDIARELAAEGLVVLPKHLKAAVEDDTVVEVKPVPRNDGNATKATTAHPQGAGDGLRDDAGSPPIENEPTAAEIRRMKRSDLEALAAKRGVDIGTANTNDDIADAIIAAAA